MTLVSAKLTPKAPNILPAEEVPAKQAEGSLYKEVIR